MAITNSPTPPSFSPASSSPDKLEEILQRIHDNVYSRSLLSNQTRPLPEYSSPVDLRLLPPLPPDLLEKITVIRNAQAPYYVVSGNTLTRVVKRLHNLVLKLFGRKQAYYNNLTLDLLESVAAYLYALQEHSKVQSSRIEALTRQGMLQTEQFMAMQSDYQKVVLGIEQTTTRQEEGQGSEQQIKHPASQQNEKQ